MTLLESTPWSCKVLQQDFHWYHENKQGYIEGCFLHILKHKPSVAVLLMLFKHKYFGGREFVFWQGLAWLCYPAEQWQSHILLIRSSLFPVEKGGERRSMSLLMFWRNKLCRTTVSVLITNCCVIEPVLRGREEEIYETHGTSC